MAYEIWTGTWTGKRPRKQLHIPSRIERGGSSKHFLASGIVTVSVLVIRKASHKTRIPKYAAYARPVELLVESRGFGALTRRCCFLLTVPALPAGNDETVDDLLSWYELGH